MKRLFTRWLLMTALLIAGLTTAVAQKSVLNEDFANGALPSGWTAAGSYWKFSDGNAKFEALVQNGVDTLFSPLTSLSSLKNKPSVAITYSNTANGARVNELKVLYRASNSASWSVLTTFDAATDGQVNWKGELPDGLANVQIALAGAYKEGVETRVYRLSIENKTEATTAPTGLRYEDLTTTSVTLYWDPCASAQFTQYNIKVNTSQMADMSIEADVLDRVGWMITDEFYELDGLSPNTEYWLYVQYDCGDGDVSPWAELSFRTPCISINAPFSENFEGAISSCYTIIKGSTAAEVNGEYPYNSTRSFKSYSAKTKYNYFILPEFNGVIKNYQVSFMAAAPDGGDTYSRSVTVGVCGEATAASFTEVKTLNLPKGRTWESIVVSLKGYAGTGKYIAFRFGNEDKENRLFIDDIHVEAASECPKPMFLEVSEITPNSAKLKWVETGNATEWNLAISTKPLADPEDLVDIVDPSKGEFIDAVSANPYTVTGLNANTTYYAYVQAGCGSGGWTNAVEFKTAKAVTYPYSEHFDRLNPDAYTESTDAMPLGWVVDDRCITAGTNYDKQYTDGTYRPYVTTKQNHEATAYVNASLLLRGASSSGYMSIAMLPAMPKAVNTMMVTFWAKAANGNQELRIGVANSQTNELNIGEQLGSNITNVGSLTISKDVWKKYSFSLKSYAGEGRYIVFSVGTPSGTPNIYIDDIEIDDIPDCSEVNPLTATALSTNSIKAEWVDGTSATSWKVKVSSTEIDPETANGDIANTTVNAKTYTATGLSMGTQYYVYVSPTCGDFWVGTNATTLSGLEIPYYNDFTNETTGAGKGAPKYWTLGNAGGSTNTSYIPYISNTAWTVSSGTLPADIVKNSLYFNAYKSNSVSNAKIPYAVMPELLNADVKDLSISFYGWVSSNMLPLNIAVVNSPANITLDLLNSKKVATAELDAIKTPKKFTIDMSSYTGTDKYIVFYIDRTSLTTNASSYFYMDNLEISKGPKRVSDVAVSLASISRTGATATWTENGTATKWNVRVFDAEQDNPAVGTPVFSTTVSSTPNAAITGLSSGTTYYVYVQSVIGSEVSVWEKTSFFTLCDPFPVPFTEDWESYGTGAGKLSQCYKDTATVKVGASNAPNATEKTGNVIQLNPSSAGQVAMLVFPEMDKPINTLQLTMAASPYTSLYVGARSHTDIGVWDGSTFEKVAEYEFNLSDLKAWDECYVDFSSYTGSGTRIALRAAYATASNSINICFDNIVIEQITPCKKITSIEITEIDSISATVSWEKSATENAWDLKVSSTKLDDPDAEAADIFDGRLTSQAKVLTGLSGSTTYYVYVRSVDAAKDCIGSWSNVKEFTTECQLMRIPFSDNYDNYKKSALPPCYFICGDDANHSVVNTGVASHVNKTQMLNIKQVTKGHNNYLVFPEMVIDDVRRLQIALDINSSATGSTSTYFFKLGVMTDPNNKETFVETHVDSIVGSTTGYRRVYKFDKYGGNEQGTEFGKFIAIKAIEYRGSTGSTYSGAIYIDNVEIDYIETCSAPSDLQADSVGINGIKYIWKTEDKTIPHRIRLFDKANADPENDAFVAEQVLNDSVTIFEGLNGNTTYYAYVRRECGANDLSKWSKEASAHTDCAEIQAIPYIETFEGCIAATAPYCWTNIGTANAIVSTSAYREGAYGISIPYTIPASQSGQSKTNAVIVTPKLDVANLNELLVYFDVKGSVAGGGLKIEAASDNTAEATVIPIKAINDISKQWSKVFIKLGDYYTSIQPYKYLRFTPIEVDEKTGVTIYVDNIVFTNNLNTVLPVADLQPKKVNVNTLTFSFVEHTPSVNAWEVAYVVTGGNIADATVIDVDVTDVTITGLNANTSYDIYVRSENTEWVGPLTMKTTNDAASIPYRTGFEDDADNTNWNLYNIQTIQGAFWTNYFIIGDAAECGATGSKALYITHNGSSYRYKLSSSSVWATRNINIVDAGTYRFTFRVKVSGNAKEDEHDEMFIRLFPAGATFRLGTNADAPILLDGTTIGRTAQTNIDKNSFLLDSALQDIPDYENRVVTLDIMEPGVYTLAMLWKNAGVGTAGDPAAIDSVIVEEYPCTKPSKFEYTARSANTVSLKWFAGKCQDFEYVVSRYANLGSPNLIDEEDKIAYGTLTAGPQLSISNLKACTNYSLYVRTICPVGETDWSEHQFTTACELEELPYTESFNELPPCWTFHKGTLESGNAGSGSSDYEKWTYLRLENSGIAVLPEFKASLNEIGIEFAIFNVTSDKSAVTIGVMDNEWDALTFTPIQLYATKEETGSTGSYNDWHLETFNKMLNLYTGTGRLLAIKNTGGAPIGIKYVKLTKLADCIQPQDVEVTNLGENTATIHWLAGVEPEWEIKLNDSIIENVTTNPYVLTELTHGTTYTIAVRALCDATHTSDWSLAQTFQTECGVNALPLNEDFSSFPTCTHKTAKPATLPCWENMYSTGKIEQVWNGTNSLLRPSLNTSWSRQWAPNAYAWGGNSQQLFFFGGNNSTNRYRWMVTPQFAIEGQASLSFDVRHIDNQGKAAYPNGRFFVAISTDNGATWKKADATEIEGIDSIYTTKSVSLDKYAGQNIRVAFYMEDLGGTTTSGQGSGVFTFVDNVRMNCTETYPYADNACQGVDYEGYGFSISKEDLPIAGEDSTYYRFAANTGMGCDSTVALTLTTRVAKTQTVYETICQGETYNFGPYSLSEPSSNNPGGAPYYITGETKYGCDSTIYLYLTVNESDTTVVDPIVKLNTELPFTTADGLLTIAAGTPISTFDTIVKVSESGCSFKKYSVTINQCTESYPYSASICEHELSYTGYGFTIAKADMPNPGSDKEYTRHSMNAAGCDSVITLTLTVLQNETIPQTAEAFNNELPKVIDTYFTIPAGSLPDGEMSVSFDTIVSIGGCSFNRYQVTVNRCTRTYGYAATLCEHETSYSDDNFNIDAAELPIPGGSAKEYTRHILTAEGCDSVITLTMNRLINDTTDIEVAIQNTDLKPDYKKDDYYTVPAGTAVGADFYTTVSIPGDNCKFNRYHVTVTQCENAYPYAEQICEDADGYVGYGFNIAKADLPEPLKSKQYTRRNPNEEGCDSIITLTLTAKNDTTKIQNTVRIIDLPFIADGVTIVPAGASAGLQPEVVTQVGTCSFKRYVITVTACDTQTDETDAICENVTSYTGYGFTIPSTEYPTLPAPGESEQYHRMVDHGSGCENITLTLTVTPNDTADINITKFNTELPYIVDAIYTIPATTTVGSHIEVLPNGNDCSYNRYNITIEQKTEEYKISDLVCEDVTNYTGNGFDIAQADMPAAGSYKTYERHGIKLDAVGVDSIVKLTLTVQKNDTLLVEDEVFNNELPYMVGNETVIAAGAATGLQPEVILANDGAICSYTRYVITVNQCVRMAEVKDTVCAGEDAYAGYGFMIPSADYTALPAIGEVGVYERHETTAEGCDSVITLRLKVMPLDTITHDKVVVKNTELPYTIDANYTIEANTPLGEYDVVIPNPDKDCSYLRYIFDVEQCIEKYPYQASVCANTNYEGYGFHIAATELPKAGQSKSYTRSNKNEAGCDSLITLTLTAIAPDTVDVVKEVLNTELPFIVDGETIVPAGASIGQQPAVVIANGDCAYKRYLITVNQCTTSFAYEDNVCAGLNYANYGFAITTAEMPAPGESKDFTRSAKDAAGCDSLITLSLSVLENDTIDHLPAYEIYISDLPLTVEGIVITPEDIKPGNYVFVFKAEGDCLYDRYYVNVLDEERGIDYVTADVDFIEVYDALGRKIQTLRQGEGQNTLPIGVYMLRTTMTDGRVVNSKLFIK